MQPIKYRWVCHKCSIVNEPGVQACTACGLSGYATAREFMPPRPESNQADDSPTSVIANSWLTFFPEIGFAAVVAISSPIWFLLLLFRGQFVAAAVLFGGVGASTYGFFVALEERSTFFAYVAMIGVLFSAYLAYRCA